MAYRKLGPRRQIGRAARGGRGHGQINDGFNDAQHNFNMPTDRSAQILSFQQPFCGDDLLEDRPWTLQHLGGEIAHKKLGPRRQISRGWGQIGYDSNGNQYIRMPPLFPEPSDDEDRVIYIEEDPWEDKQKTFKECAPRVPNLITYRQPKLIRPKTKIGVNECFKNLNIAGEEYELDEDSEDEEDDELISEYYIEDEEEEYYTDEEDSDDDEALYYDANDFFADTDDDEDDEDDEDDNDVTMKENIFEDKDGRYAVQYHVFDDTDEDEDAELSWEHFCKAPAVDWRKYWRAAKPRAPNPGDKVSWNSRRRRIYLAQHMLDPKIAEITETSDSEDEEQEQQPDPA